VSHSTRFTKPAVKRHMYGTNSLETLNEPCHEFVGLQVDFRTLEQTRPRQNVCRIVAIGMWQSATLPVRFGLYFTCAWSLSTRISSRFRSLCTQSELSLIVIVQQVFQLMQIDLIGCPRSHLHNTLETKGRRLAECATQAFLAASEEECPICQHTFNLRFRCVPYPLCSF